MKDAFVCSWSLHGVLRVAMPEDLKELVRVTPLREPSRVVAFGP
jgi:hypothetical protein